MLRKVLPIFWVLAAVGLVWGWAGADKPIGAAPENPIRLTTAAQCAPSRVVLTGSQAVGVVVERGDPPAGASDQTPTVRVLVLQAGNGGTDAGSVVALGGAEVVVDLGQLSVRPGGTPAIAVGN